MQKLKTMRSYSSAGVVYYKYEKHTITQRPPDQ